MENIFENADFGKPYRTRDGRKALYIGDFVNDKISLLTEQNGTIWVSIDGHSDYKYNDIVSEWQEEPFGNTSDAKFKFGEAKLLIDEVERHDLDSAHYPSDEETDAISFC